MGTTQNGGYYASYDQAHALHLTKPSVIHITLSFPFALTLAGQIHWAGPGRAHLLPLRDSQWDTGGAGGEEGLDEPARHRVELGSFLSCFSILFPPGAEARPQPLTSGSDFSEHGAEEDLITVPGGQSRQAPWSVPHADLWML